MRQSRPYCYWSLVTVPQTRSELHVGQQNECSTFVTSHYCTEHMGETSVKVVNLKFERFHFILVLYLVKFV